MVNGSLTLIKRHKEYNIVRARIDIELVVDGDIVDLNRIGLPMDTPIIDKRFKDVHTDPMR
jgi:hypothetical protein